MRSREAGSGVSVKSKLSGTSSLSTIAGVQSGASLSLPSGPSRTPLTRSTTMTTESSLPMPRVGLPPSPNASLAGAATATREPTVWPSMASRKTFPTWSLTVISSGFFSS